MFAAEARTIMLEALQRCTKQTANARPFAGFDAQELRSGCMGFLARVETYSP